MRILFLKKVLENYVPEKKERRTESVFWKIIW